MGSASGMMSGQQAVANILGLELNVKNGDNGIFVSQLLQGAGGEEAFRVYGAATPTSNQTGSRQKQDWRRANCLSTGSACCLNRSGLGDYRGALGGRAASPARRGSPKTHSWCRCILVGLCPGMGNSAKMNPPTSYPKRYLAQENLCHGGT